MASVVGAQLQRRPSWAIRNDAESAVGIVLPTAATCTDTERSISRTASTSCRSSSRLSVSISSPFLAMSTVSIAARGASSEMTVGDTCEASPFSFCMAARSTEKLS